MCAFDAVWHEGLVVKLKNIGIEGKMLEFFVNYLKNRKICVQVDGELSAKRSINASVPQASILGPILFIVFMDDLVDILKENVWIYADDVVLAYKFFNNTYSTRDYQCMIDNLIAWSKKWRVGLNPAKTKLMLCSRKRNKIYPLFKMENTQLEYVTETKHLGVTLSDDMKWNCHINNIILKANQRLGILGKLKFRLKSKVL